MTFNMYQDIMIWNLAVKQTKKTTTTNEVGWGERKKDVYLKRIKNIKA